MCSLTVLHYLLPSGYSPIIPKSRPVSITHDRLPILSEIAESLTGAIFKLPIAGSRITGVDAGGGCRVGDSAL